MPRTKTGRAKSTAMSQQHAPLLGSQSRQSLSRRRVGSVTCDNPTAIHRKAQGGAAAAAEASGRDAAMEFKDLSRKSQWIALAVLSGGCAAFNGVFAKLTTTELTTTFATWVATLVGLGNGEKVVEVVVRGIFFSLNLIFNGIMWALFTKALARGTSTTQVSILNTSSNFMLTAVLGWLIFSESLPPLWFLGAALLVAGNVIIGRREEKEEDKSADRGEGEGLLGGEGSEEVELDDGLGLGVDDAKRRGREEEDVLQLDLQDEEDLLDLRR